MRGGAPGALTCSKAGRIFDSNPEGSRKRALSRTGKGKGSMSEKEAGAAGPTIEAGTLKEWNREGRKVRGVGIRSPEQHAAGHIPGAENEFINAALKQGDAKAVDRIEAGDGVPIVTVCNQGGSCRIASDLLRK